MNVLKVLTSAKVVFIVRKVLPLMSLCVELSLRLVKVVINKEKKSALVLKNKAREDRRVVLLYIPSLGPKGLECILVHIESVLLNPVLPVFDL